MEQVLSIKNLNVQIREAEASRGLIQGMDFEIPGRKIVALVGGSGCGKTTTAYSVLRLLSDSMRIVSGEILFGGRDLLKMSQRDMLRIRGRHIGMIFQESLSAFNPVFPVGFQIAEVLRVHTALSRGGITRAVLDLLSQVGIERPRRVFRSFPHQLSGGMRQRAMIAQAIAVNPELVIADEPTSNLDVTLQAHIIELFRKLKEDMNISILLITHDIGLVRALTDEIAVMFNGRVVESGRTRDVLAAPRHAYTNELIKALRD